MDRWCIWWPHLAGFPAPDDVNRRHETSADTAWHYPAKSLLAPSSADCLSLDLACPSIGWRAIPSVRQYVPKKIAKNHVFWGKHWADSHWAPLNRAKTQFSRSMWIRPVSMMMKLHRLWLWNKTLNQQHHQQQQQQQQQQQKQQKQLL